MSLTETQANSRTQQLERWPWFGYAIDEILGPGNWMRCRRCPLTDPEIETYPRMEVYHEKDFHDD